MARRENHYEAAFEACLRAHGVPALVVDETRRAQLGGDSLKNLDFIVSPPERQVAWLVDVKGRKFPSGRGKQYFKYCINTLISHNKSSFCRYLTPAVHPR